MPRKRRTRQHIIADLGVNHVERFALQAGCAVDEVQRDYGIDLYVHTYDHNEEIENGHILVQVKATDRVTVLASQPVISVRLKRADIDRWLGEIMPVLLVVYDAVRDVAYWLDIQAYFESQAAPVLSGTSGTATVHLLMSNQLAVEIFRQLGAHKNRLVARSASWRPSR